MFENNKEPTWIWDRKSFGKFVEKYLDHVLSADNPWSNAPSFPKEIQLKLEILIENLIFLQLNKTKEPNDRKPKETDKDSFVKLCCKTCKPSCRRYGKSSLTAFVANSSNCDFPLTAVLDTCSIAKETNKYLKR